MNTRGDISDSQFDALIEQHLDRELTPHLGRATDKLTTALIAQPMSRRFIWRAGRFAVAAALLVGVGAASSFVFRHYWSSQRIVDNPVATTASPRPFSDSITTNWTQTYDAGTVLVDPATPARLFRRVEYQQIDWQDESGVWQSKIVVPREDLIVVDLIKQ